MKNEVKTLIVNDLVKDLKSGLTRWKKDDLGYGSIQEKYNLDNKDMKKVIQCPELKRVRTQIPSLILVSNVKNNNSDNVNQVKDLDNNCNSNLSTSSANESNDKGDTNKVKQEVEKQNNTKQSKTTEVNDQKTSHCKIEVQAKKLETFI